MLILKKFNPFFLLKNLISISKFKKFNKKNINNYIYPKKNVILMEYYPQHESLIAIGEVSKILREKHQSNIVMYKPAPFKSKMKKYLFSLIKWNPFSIYSIYKSFDIKDFTQPDEGLYQEELNRIYNKILKNIKNKKDILDIKIDNIYFGDLIYDGCLRFNKKPTINIENKELNKFLKFFLSSYLHWKNYFKIYNVNAVVCSHLFYEDGILSRICIFKGIECYQASQNFIFKTSKKFKSHLEYWSEFKKIFNKFGKTKKKYIIEEGKKFLKSNTKIKLSKIVNKRKENLKKNKLKILIAVHCLYDAPHAFGKFNFLDFEEWLMTILNFSKKNNYQWLIKIHPNCYDADIGVLKKIVNEYKNIKILPKYMEHDDIVKNGITHVLSVYGSIGVEYAGYYSIPVIMASYNNPYKAYNFVIKSKSKKYFYSLLSNLKNVNIKINKKEIYQFLYMRFFYSFNLLFNFREYQTQKNKADRETYVYDYFLNNINTKKQTKRIKELNQKIFKNQKGVSYIGNI